MGENFVKRQLGRTRMRWENNTNINLREMDCEMGGRWKCLRFVSSGGRSIISVECLVSGVSVLVQSFTLKFNSFSGCVKGVSRLQDHGVIFCIILCISVTDCLYNLLTTRRSKLYLQNMCLFFT